MCELCRRLHADSDRRVYRNLSSWREKGLRDCGGDSGRASASYLSSEAAGGGAIPSIPGDLFLMLAVGGAVLAALVAAIRVRAKWHRDNLRKIV